MKGYRVLLSVLLSLAMILGMVGGAFAEPAGGRVTLRNVVLNLNGEEIVIGPEASVSALADEDALKLHFEAANGEKTLLPVTGQLDAAGVRFTLGNSGRVYALSMDTLLSMADLSEEDLQIVEFIVEAVDVCAALMNLELTEENTEAYFAMADAMLSALVGAPAQEVEMEVGGTTYTMASYQGKMTLGSAIAALEVMRGCDVKEIADYAQLILDLMNMSVGAQTASFEEWIRISMEAESEEELDSMLNTAIADVEYALGGDDVNGAVRMTMTLADMGDDTKGSVDMEMVGNDQIMDMTMNMEIGDGESNTVTTMVMHADADAATMTMNQNTTSPYDYSTDVIVTCNATMAQDEMTGFDANVSYISGYSTVEEGIVDAMSTAVTLVASGSATDGLWDMSMGINVNNEYSYGAEGEAEIYSDSVSLGGGYAETAEADGSVTGAVTLSMEAEDENYAVSFDINVASGVEIAELAAEGDNVVALTENTEDEGYMLMSADLMNLYADAMELLADEGIMQLVTMFSGPVEVVEDTVDEAVID